MTAKIYEFTGITTLDLDPERVLAKAQGKLQAVVVIGFDHKGDFYGASNYADGGDMLWLLELCKKRLLEVQ